MLTSLVLALAAQQILEVEPIAAPSAAPGLYPELRSAPDGTVVALWQEPRSRSAARLLYARWDGGDWSEPALVATGEDWFVNWADFPALAVASDGTLAATWLEKLGGQTFAYGARLSRLSPDAAAWTEPRFLHTDSTPVEHGFVSLTPLADGRVHAAWLDGRALPRAGRDKPGSHEFGGHGRMALLGATIEADGARGAELVLDARVCSCCQTDAAVLSDGTVVLAYRDRSQEEVRDISLVRGVPGEEASWCGPVSVADDGWKIHGCPVNGPALAAAGQRAAVAWYTEGSRERPGVQFAFVGAPRHAGDGRAPAPVPGRVQRVSGRSALGRVDLVALADGSFLLSSLQKTDSGAEWRAQLVAASGELGPPVTISPASRGRDGGFLRLAPTADGALAAWTDADTRTLRCARLRVRAARPVDESF